MKAPSTRVPRRSTESASTASQLRIRTRCASTTCSRTAARARPPRCRMRPTALLEHVPAEWQPDCFESVGNPFDEGIVAARLVHAGPTTDPTSSTTSSTTPRKAWTRSTSSAWTSTRSSPTGSCQTGPNETGYTIGGVAGRAHPVRAVSRRNSRRLDTRRPDDPDHADRLRGQLRERLPGLADRRPELTARVRADSWCRRSAVIRSFVVVGAAGVLVIGCVTISPSGTVGPSAVYPGGGHSCATTRDSGVATAAPTARPRRAVHEPADRGAHSRTRRGDGHCRAASIRGSQPERGRELRRAYAAVR